MNTLVRYETAAIRGLRGRIHIKFYSRIMLVNILIFIIIACILAFIAINYSTQLDISKEQQRNHDALNAVCNYYTQKYDEFPDIAYLLYQNSADKEKLYRFLDKEDDSGYANDSFTLTISNIFSNVKKTYYQITNVLIYKNKTKKVFNYDFNANTLELVNYNFPFCKDLKASKLGRHILGTRMINKNSNSFGYGIAVSVLPDNQCHSLGALAFIYDVKYISSILQDYSHNIEGRFLLFQDEGRIIFDSQAGYGKNDYTKILNGIKSLSQDNGDIYIDGVRNNVQVISKDNCIAVHAVSLSDIATGSNNTKLLLLLIFLGMILISAFLYILAGVIASRRVKELEKAMACITPENLSYRLPLRKWDDEYKYISARFNEMCDRLQDTTISEYIAKVKAKNAELKALQTGINPHFLYNTLATIRSKAFEEGNGNVSEMIMFLANLYRHVTKGSSIVFIKDELMFCDMYLNIFSLRYEYNFLVKRDIDPSILEYGIPKLILQPVIENYFVHGIRNKDTDNMFFIKGFKDAGDILFIIEDNGRGIDRKQLTEIDRSFEDETVENSQKYGLSSVNERIRLVYGKSYGLSLESAENVYTRVTIRIRAVSCEEIIENMHV